jgi:putative transposase
MSIRSFTKIWLHLIWGTYNHEKVLLERGFRKQLSEYLFNYSTEKKIFMKTNYVNSDHVHALIDLPTNITVEDVFHLYKGSSSNWVNKNVNYKFSWAKGYAAFSVSESIEKRVCEYIKNQEGHHRRRSFAEEYDEFIKNHKVIIVKE